MNQLANIQIPSPRRPLEQTTPVAEVLRERLTTSSSTEELRRRIAAARS